MARLSMEINFVFKNFKSLSVLVSMMLINLTSSKCLFGLETLVKKHDFKSFKSWLIGLFWLVKCPFWLKVHHMNGHCSYWLINLINDDPFDYLPNGTFNEVKQKMISMFKMGNGFYSNGTFGQVEQARKTSLVKMANGFSIK